MSLLENALRRSAQQRKPVTVMRHAAMLPSMRFQFGFNYKKMLMFVLMVALAVSAYVWYRQRPTPSPAFVSTPTQTYKSAASRGNTYKKFLSRRKLISKLKRQQMSTTMTAVEKPQNKKITPVAATTPEKIVEERTLPQRKTTINNPVVSFGDSEKAESSHGLQSKYHKAIRLIAEGATNEAIVLLNLPGMALASHNQSVAALYEIYLKRGDSALARYVLVNKPVNVREHPEFLMKIANNYAERGDYLKSVSILERASPSLVKHITYYGELAHFYLKASRVASAVDIYQRLVRHEPSEAKWWLGLAVAYQVSEKYQQALASYRQVAKMPGLSMDTQQFISKQMVELQQLYDFSEA